MKAKSKRIALIFAVLLIIGGIVGAVINYWHPMDYTKTQADYNRNIERLQHSQSTPAP